jgi:hypothetical protein
MMYSKAEVVKATFGADFIDAYGFSANNFDA